RRGLVNGGQAVPALVEQFVSAPYACVQLQILANEQVQPPVVVVIKPGSARTPPRRRQPSLGRDIGECAISIVVIEDTSGILSDVDIGEPICVVIAHGNPHTVSVSRYTGFFRNVGESTVPV